MASNDELVENKKRYLSISPTPSTAAADDQVLLVAPDEILQLESEIVSASSKSAEQATNEKQMIPVGSNQEVQQQGNDYQKSRDLALEEVRKRIAKQQQQVISGLSRKKEDEEDLVSPPTTALARSQHIGLVNHSPGAFHVVPLNPLTHQPYSSTQDEDDIRTLSRSRGPSFNGSRHSTGGSSVASNITDDSQEEEGEDVHHHEPILSSPIPATLVDEDQHVSSTDTNCASTSTGAIISTALLRQGNNSCVASEAGSCISKDGDEEKGPVHEPHQKQKQQPPENTMEEDSSELDISLQQAKPYLPEDARRSMRKRMCNRMHLCLICVMLLVICFLTLGLTGVFTPTNSEEGYSDTRAGTTLQRIRQDGVLRCGYHTTLPGALFQDRNGDFTGVMATVCKAVAAAANARAEFVQVPNNEDLRPCLAAGDFDLTALAQVHSMEAEVYDQNAKSPFAFSSPYAWGGLRVFGDPFHIDQCVDAHMKHTEECNDLVVCVNDDKKAFYDTLREMLPLRRISVWNDTDEAFLHGFLKGHCNVIAGEEIFINTIPLRFSTLLDSDKEYKTGVVDKIPHAAMTRVDDPEFSDFVAAVYKALYAAEKYNITKETADDLFPQTFLFGDEYKNMFRNAVSVGGSAMDIFDSFVGKLLSPDTVNLVSPDNDETGLLLAQPFGDISQEPEHVSLGMRIPQILNRQRLRCGIIVWRPGFTFRSTAESDQEGSQYTGMDIDYCKALAASLFQGDATAVEYVEVLEPQYGFQLLANDEIDVLAGATWTLENDVREPTTGLGFDLSSPYFYGYSPEYDNFCLATMQDDHYWSAFVAWTVMATIYAEQHASHIESFNDMPQVLLYGKPFQRMFRDANWVVGSYAEIYQRNVQSIIPRHGRNMLNVFPNAGPQIYIPPGFV